MQNSELKKEILGRHSQVSAKELEKYRNGELSGDRARDVEMKLHSNTFSAEAAEGFETYGAGMNIANTGSAWKTTNYSWVAWSSAILIGIVSLGFVANSFMSTSDEQIAAEISTESTIVNETKPKAVLPESNSTPAVTLQEKTSAVKEESQLSNSESSNSSDSEEEIIPVLFSGAMEEEIFQISPMERKEAEIGTNINSTKPKSQKVRLRHYRNYKLVDQNIGFDQSLLKPILDNSPPFSETIVVNPEIPEWVAADSVYKITINKAIDFLIDKKYGEAQMKLERLVENNATDLTATFYLGYVLYLRENYKEAILYFNKAESHIIQTYDHDARFLELNALLQLGRIEEAKEEADHLITAGSFYSDKARDLAY